MRPPLRPHPALPGLHLLASACWPRRGFRGRGGLRRWGQLGGLRRREGSGLAPRRSLRAPQAAARGVLRLRQLAELLLVLLVELQLGAELLRAELLLRLLLLPQGRRLPLVSNNSFV